MAKEYRYFFSWFYSDGKTNIYNHGNITCKYKIDSYEDIEKVADAIAKNNKYKHNPTILFFKELGKERVTNGNTEENH